MVFVFDFVFFYDRSGNCYHVSGQAANHKICIYFLDENIMVQYFQSLGSRVDHLARRANIIMMIRTASYPEISDTNYTDYPKSERQCLKGSIWKGFDQFKIVQKL